MPKNEGLRDLFDIAIKAHLACGMIKNPNGNFALTDDLVDKLEQLGYIKKPSVEEIEKIIRDNGEYHKEFACGLSDRLVVYPKQLAHAISAGLGGKEL